MINTERVLELRKRLSGGAFYAEGHVLNQRGEGGSDGWLSDFGPSWVGEEHAEYFALAGNVAPLLAQENQRLRKAITDFEEWASAATAGTEQGLTALMNVRDVARKVLR